MAKTLSKLDHAWDPKTWSRQFTHRHHVPNDIRIGTWKLKEKHHITYLIRRPNTPYDYYTENFILVYQNSSISILDFDAKTNKVLVQLTDKLRERLDENILDDYYKVD